MQVDLRILKAVASKYSTDINSAVEFVLSDVLPAVSESKPTETYYPLPPKFDDVDQTYPTRKYLLILFESKELYLSVCLFYLVNTA